MSMVPRNAEKIFRCHLYSVECAHSPLEANVFAVILFGSCSIVLVPVRSLDPVKFTHRLA